MNMGMTTDTIRDAIAREIASRSARGAIACCVAVDQVQEVIIALPDLQLRTPAIRFKTTRGSAQISADMLHRVYMLKVINYRTRLPVAQQS
jgi:hypothetical protein